MKTFETRGPVDASRNYVVKRTTELADFVDRVKQGRYIVIFAPRQTGKTTFFRWALDALAAEGITYFFPDSIGMLKTSFQIQRSNNCLTQRKTW